MEVQVFRARTMQEALQQVRCALGPDAAVLQTRQVRRGFLRWLSRSREIEVLAAASVNVPSRFPETAAAELVAPRSAEPGHPDRPAGRAVDESAPLYQQDYRAKFREDLKGEFADLHS